MDRDGAPLFDAGKAGADDVGHPGGAAGAKVDDATTAHVPEPRAFALDVGVQCIGHEGSVRGAEIEGRGGAQRWLRIRLLVQPDAVIVRVFPSILPRQLRDDAVGEHDGRVAGPKVAPIDALPHEFRAREGEVVVHDVELIEATGYHRQVDRGAVDAKAFRIAGYPERRVAGGEHEFGGGWCRGTRLGAGGVAAAGEGREQREESPGEQHLAHRREI